MKEIKFNNCKSRNDIENVIMQALMYDNIVTGNSAANKWFKVAGIHGEVHHNCILSDTVSIWNDDMDREERYRVKVTEHYVDSGSVDYVYSYEIS